jgi:serine/threonine protein kinase
VLSDAALEKPLIVGRYALFDALASGGMATVHLGRLLGASGFGRTVAVKRLHPQFGRDPDFVTMFMDEARIVARIRHPNVVPMVDVIESRKGIFLVMEYVHGESFAKLLRICRASQIPVPIKIVSGIMHAALLGLHAAHDTLGDKGELLGVVHRDVSPQNVMVGGDGIARVLDFGVAKAAGRAQVTREGELKGKLTYMAPEQIRGHVDRRADVFAAAIILWEALAGRRFHDNATDVEIVTKVIEGDFVAPSAFRAEVPTELDAIVLRGLSVDLHARYQTARDMAHDLEHRIGLAHPSEIGEWVEKLAGEALQARTKMVAAMEKASASMSPSDSVPPPEAVVPSVGTPLVALPRRSQVHVVAILSFLAALAIVGAALGAFALYTRKTSNKPASATTSSARVAGQTSRPAATIAPEPPPAASAASSSAPTVTTAATPTPTPHRVPVATPTPKRPEKKACDPPYTTDEHGRRKYKLECIE